MHCLHLARENITSIHNHNANKMGAKRGTEAVAKTAAAVVERQRFNDSASTSSTRECEDDGCVSTCVLATARHNSAAFRNRIAHINNKDNNNGSGGRAAGACLAFHVAADSSMKDDINV